MSLIFYSINVDILLLRRSTESKVPTLHAVTGLIRAGNTRKGADSLSNFCLDDLIIKLVKLNSSLVIFGSFIAR
ncbi:MAG: hypothetical protein CMQ26_02410 [Gammaproteobacteria bacterium]|nr:hypothetical protein [Gammaproteobacteria bacterium]